MPVTSTATLPSVSSIASAPGSLKLFPASSVYGLSPFIVITGGVVSIFSFGFTNIFTLSLDFIV